MCWPSRRERLRAEMESRLALALAIEHLACVLNHLIDRLPRIPVPASSFTISQLGDTRMGQINGIQAGASGTFVATPTPAGGALQAGSIPTWATDHPDVTSLVVSPDGLTCVATVAPTAGAGTFTLTISGVASDGTKISGSASVPITAAAAVPATGFDISQTS